MSHYVHGSSLSYIDYLQARSFTDSVDTRISRENSRLIATVEELRESSSGAVEVLGDQFVACLTEIGAQISDGLAEVNATLEWGFSEILVELGEMNTSLTDLIQLAKTPVQTWAYNQFEIARDAFRQRLYPEALEYALRSINGHGDNTGYTLEYRFHFLVGTIYMGSFRNSEPELLDLAKAERSFLNAGRYASSHHPK